MYLENIHLTAGVSAQHAALMVDHYGNPTLRDLDDGDLRTSMAELARYANGAVKLSGVPSARFAAARPSSAGSSATMRLSRMVCRSRGRAFSKKEII